MEIKIDIGTQGPYDTRKEFNHIVEMDIRQYLGLVNVVLDYLDTLKKVDNTSANVA